MSGNEVTDQIPVFVTYGNTGQNSQVVISKDATVRDLVREVKNVTNTNIEDEDVMLNFAGKTLEHGRTLRHYGIERDSTVWFSVRLHGGTIKRQKLSPVSQQQTPPGGALQGLTGFNMQQQQQFSQHQAGVYTIGGLQAGMGNQEPMLSPITDRKLYVKQELRNICNARAQGQSQPSTSQEQQQLPVSEYSGTSDEIPADVLESMENMLKKISHGILCATD